MMSDHRLWGFDEEQRVVLLSATTQLPDAVQVGARLDLVSDAGRDDREDRGRADTV